MRSAFAAIYMREIRVAGRIGGSGSMGVVFFLTLVTITPFAVGPDPNLLARIGPAMLWISALLASLLGLDRLFQADAEDGSLDQFHLSHTPLELAVLAKCAAHWTTAGLPLVLAAPVLGLILQQDGMALAGVVASLLVGSPALTFIGAIGAGGDRDRAARRPVDGAAGPAAHHPVLIFGVSAANAAAGGTVPFSRAFSILCAISLVSLALCPFAAAAALRQL